MLPFLIWYHVSLSESFPVPRNSTCVQLLSVPTTSPLGVALTLRTEQFTIVFVFEVVLDAPETEEFALTSPNPSMIPPAIALPISALCAS